MEREREFNIGDLVTLSQYKTADLKRQHIPVISIVAYWAETCPAGTQYHYNGRVAWLGGSLREPASSFTEMKKFHEAELIPFDEEKYKEWTAYDELEDYRKRMEKK